MPSPTTNRILYGGQKNYVLDKLGSDAVNSLVLGMSYVRLTKKYKGACLRVMRASDFSSIWVEFSAGYIAISQIAAFCAGTEGRCPEHCNQSILAGVQNAVQATWTNMPIVFASGAFNADGLRFVAASSNFMSVVDYAGIQIVEPPLSIYIGVKNWTTGYVYAKNETGISDIQFAWGSGVYLFFNSVNILSPQLANETIINWASKAANGINFKSEKETLTATVSNSLINYNFFTIGARKNNETYTTYANMNMKTLCIFNSDQYNNYSNFVNGGM